MPPIANRASRAPLRTSLKKFNAHAQKVVGAHVPPTANPAGTVGPPKSPKRDQLGDAGDCRTRHGASTRPAPCGSGRQTRWCWGRRLRSTGAEAGSRYTPVQGNQAYGSVGTGWPGGRHIPARLHANWRGGCGTHDSRGQMAGPPSDGTSKLPMRVKPLSGWIRLDGYRFDDCVARTGRKRSTPARGTAPRADAAAPTLSSRHDRKSAHTARAAKGHAAAHRGGISGRCRPASR